MRTHLAVCAAVQVSRASSDDEFHAAIRFDVSDTGVGIPHDQQDRIFGRFAKVRHMRFSASLAVTV